MIAERKYKRLTPELRAAAVQTVAKVATEEAERRAREHKVQLAAATELIATLTAGMGPHTGRRA